MPSPILGDPTNPGQAERNNMDNVQLRTYELTFVLPGSLTDSEATTVKDEVEKILKKYKAKVVNNEDWGRRPLAYIISHEGKKQSEGYYTHLVLELVPTEAQNLERDIYLSSKIMRHLLLVADEKQLNQAPAPTEAK